MQKKFCESIRLQDIEELHLTTHRRVSFWAKDFYEKQKNKSDRKAILKEIQSKVSKSAETSGSVIYSTSTS